MGLFGKIFDTVTGTHFCSSMESLVCPPGAPGTSGAPDTSGAPPSPSPQSNNIGMSMETLHTELTANLARLAEIEADRDAIAARSDELELLVLGSVDRATHDTLTAEYSQLVDKYTEILNDSNTLIVKNTQLSVQLNLLASEYASISETDDEVVGLEGTVVNLEGTVVELEGTVAELEGTVVELEGTVVELEETIHTLHTSETEHLTNIAQLNQRITLLLGELVNHDTVIDGLRSDALVDAAEMGRLLELVRTVEEADAAKDANIEEITFRYNRLQIEYEELVARYHSVTHTHTSPSNIEIVVPGLDYKPEIAKYVELYGFPDNFEFDDVKLDAIRWDIYHPEADH
jgi:chromosome segregation ATPase